MLIQYILILIILFIILQTIKKRKADNISFREFLFWLIFWIGVGAVVLLPQVTSLVAEKLGVGRGADLVVYAGLLFVFYMIFRIFEKQKNIEREISKIVEDIANKRD